MIGLSSLLILSLAQAHLTYLLLKAEILRPLRERLGKKRPKLQYLLQCPVCLGVWAAVVVLLVPSLISLGLAVAGVGHAVYEFKEKYLPCHTCTSGKSTGNWTLTQ